jgi:hypothetical protein
MRAPLVFVLGCLFATASAAGEARVPMQVDPAFLRALLLERSFTDPDQTALVYSDGVECNRLTLLRPEVDAAGARLRVTSDVDARFGTLALGVCLFPVSWQGRVESELEPSLDPALPLVHFRVVDSTLLERDGAPPGLASRSGVRGAAPAARAPADLKACGRPARGLRCSGAMRRARKRWSICCARSGRGRRGRRDRHASTRAAAATSRRHLATRGTADWRSSRRPKRSHAGTVSSLRRKHAAWRRAISSSASSCSRCCRRAHRDRAAGAGVRRTGSRARRSSATWRVLASALRGSAPHRARRGLRWLGFRPRPTRLRR